MARLSDEEFRSWCQRNTIDPPTQAYIQRLRESEPDRKVRIEEPQEAQVLEGLQAYPGVSVRSLLDAHPGLPVDVIWALLIKQSLFIDLSAAIAERWAMRETIWKVVGGENK